VSAAGPSLGWIQLNAAAGKDKPNGRPSRSHLFRKLQSVGAGPERQVGNGRVIRPLLEALQRLQRGSGVIDDVSIASESAAQHRSDGRLVVDGEDAQAASTGGG
jgi:hypothetical protein